MDWLKQVNNAIVVLKDVLEIHAVLKIAHLQLDLLAINQMENVALQLVKRKQEEQHVDESIRTQFQHQHVTDKLLFATNACQLLIHA